MKEQMKVALTSKYTYFALAVGIIIGLGLRSIGAG